MSIYKERGVVLHSTKYGEGQLIVHVLTAARGRQSYITRVGRATSKGSARGAGRGLFQPLFLLEFQGDDTLGSDLHRMSQVTSSYVLRNMPFDVVKSSIAMFMSEMLYRLTLVEGVMDERLYSFVEQSVIELDTAQCGVANFHLHFMVRLANFLGYEARSNWQPGVWLDIKRGEYVALMPQHPLKIEPWIAQVLHELDGLQVGQLDDVHLVREQRVEVMNALVEYYHYHTEAIAQVRAIRILGELF